VAADGAQPVETTAAAPLPPTTSATPEAAPAPATPIPAATQPSPPRPRREAEPIDLLDVAGGSVAKRALPALGVVALLTLLFVVLRRRKH
jgi:hypothetical protein